MGRYNVLMLLAALVLPVAAAHATPTTFTTSLTQANEVPPTGSPATGSATIALDPAANTLGVHVTFSGLTSNTTMAHIHCCLAFPLESQFNIGVATTRCLPFPGSPWE